MQFKIIVIAPKMQPAAAGIKPLVNKLEITIARTNGVNIRSNSASLVATTGEFLNKINKMIDRITINSFNLNSLLLFFSIP